MSTQLVGLLSPWRGVVISLGAKVTHMRNKWPRSRVRILHRQKLGTNLLQNASSVFYKPYFIIIRWSSYQFYYYQTFVKILSSCKWSFERSFFAKLKWRLLNLVYSVMKFQFNIWFFMNRQHFVFSWIELREDSDESASLDIILLWMQRRIRIWTLWINMQGSFSSLSLPYTKLQVMCIRCSLSFRQGCSISSFTRMQCSHIITKGNKASTPSVCAKFWLSTLDGQLWNV